MAFYHLQNRNVFLEETFSLLPPLGAVHLVDGNPPGN
jgi:hypothetical protein